MNGKNDGRVERRVATVEDLDLRQKSGSKPANNPRTCGRVRPTER